MLCRETIVYSGETPYKTRLSISNARERNEYTSELEAQHSSHHAPTESRSRPETNWSLAAWTRKSSRTVSRPTAYRSGQLKSSNAPSDSRRRVAVCAASRKYARPDESNGGWW